MEIVRWTAAVVLVIFSAATVYVTLTENFWKSCKKVFALKWGWQVVADLYIGIFLFTFFVYLIEKSVLTTLLWFISAAILGNPVTLLYFVINFNSIVEKFL